MNNGICKYLIITLLSIATFCLTSCTKDPEYEQGEYLYLNQDLTKVDLVNGLVIRWNDTMGISEEQKVVVRQIVANLVKVEGGEFMMGAQHTDAEGIQYDPEALDGESPVHQVSLSDYYIGKYEVTQQEWRAVMGNDLDWTSYYGSGDRMPAYRLTWTDANNFVTRLSLMTHLDFQVPTEAQWEFAARGGNSSQQYRFSGSDDVNAVAWHKNNAGGMLHNVGEKQPNELGLYDMSGNLWEWCRDSYNEYTTEFYPDPLFSWGEPYVLRGGSWTYFPTYCRVTARDSYSDQPSIANGFRVSLQIP